MVQRLLFVLFGISTLLGHVYCGRVRRVVGGERMAMGAWPWLVSLNYKEHHAYLELQGLDHLCGATLIRPSWVITAAHCVHHMSGSDGLGVASNWIAVLGEYNRLVEEQSEQRVDVEEILISPSYTLFPNLTGDIALLKLRHPAIINAAVRPVEIDMLRAIPEGSECQAAGWGQHAPDDYGQPQYGNGTMVPHAITVRKVSTHNCLAAYGHHWPLIDHTVICFQSDERKDTCKGDSGGPLVCLDNEGVPVLTGIVSVGMGCALENYPGIYTRVASYRDWILSTIKTHTRVTGRQQRRHQPQQQPIVEDDEAPL